jgi:diphosphomevalonate decarboxylase
MEKIDVVKHILRHTNHGTFVNSNGGYAYAPSNIAICKYWGKRDTNLNLPVTSSLSLSLGKKGAFTAIKHNEQTDNFILNNEPIAPNTKFAKRLSIFLNLFRPHRKIFYDVTIQSNVPIAAGFASSACGFAALVQALNNLYDWHLTKTELSILARLGSGSACRSLWDGFVEWQQGEDPNGMDSHGVSLPYIWPELRLGAIVISNAAKSISSTDAMQITALTSPLYEYWPQQANADLTTIKYALAKKDFTLLASTAEYNAIAMHEMMRAATPAINYGTTLTFSAIQKIQELRKAGTPVYFTQDAGPNLQLFFLATYEKEILQTFPETEIILPFSDPNTSNIILVDSDDKELDSGEKLTVHLQGKLHRAFSVFILRRSGINLELLLQQRSATKYHSPELWTNTCCGHPKPGETVIEAAHKRLQFEMGITASLEEVGVFHYAASLNNGTIFENEIDHVLIGFLGNEDFIANSDEVKNYEWVEIKACYKELMITPNKFTIWLQPALEIVLKYINNLVL